jgi:acyl-CoA thioester hydrolase
MSVFTWTARVYYQDTDAGGVVFYANYLGFMERARTEWLRARGFSQATLAADPGVLFAVAEAEIRYRRPARLDDVLVISCEPARSGRAALEFRQQIWRERAGGELLTEGRVRVVCVDAVNFRPCRLPESILPEVG